MPLSSALFLFCGRRRDRIKALFREPDGFTQIYKRLSVCGAIHGPGRSQAWYSQVANLSTKERFILCSKI
ncbi:IS66 family insertion sequence element accessory protein TnpB [Blautia pseudococcoides]|uniref:Uncharacterized protein n=1 Tax=Blautia pseudococcoides TaxID=1796616 RepID=A0A1V0QEM5_9FIRM|nr:hypothetical protein A4V09_24050 [Blautia pseudococcoides]ASU28797.1 hypothetical protein ADH70_008010 [Blautia pseudococcoides]QQQ93561.1 IS66 family insertion sequence element accessory protein TnpB [Blautia pseudococcoides]